MNPKSQFIEFKNKHTDGFKRIWVKIISSYVNIHKNNHLPPFIPGSHCMRAEIPVQDGQTNCSSVSD